VFLEKSTGKSVDKMALIFVSSTFKDLEECREKIRNVLRRMGHEEVAMDILLQKIKGPLASFWKRQILQIFNAGKLLPNNVIQVVCTL